MIGGIEIEKLHPEPGDIILVRGDFDYSMLEEIAYETKLFIVWLPEGATIELMTKEERDSIAKAWGEYEASSREANLDT